MRAIFAAVFAWLMASCSPTENALKDGAVVSLKINETVYSHIEIAAQATSRQRGLMFRDSLDEQAGMLFVFEDDAIRSFWMKNTRIPLDIVYLDAQWKVVSTCQMKAEPPRQALETDTVYEMRLPAYSSQKPARYALELQAGQISKANIKKGTSVIILSH